VSREGGVAIKTRALAPVWEVFAYVLVRCGASPLCQKAGTFDRNLCSLSALFSLQFYAQSEILKFRQVTKKPPSSSSSIYLH
jgi:hypothetical protein